MQSKLTEETIQALHSIQFAADHIRRAHGAACETLPIVAIVLRDLIADSERMRQRLAELVELLPDSSP